MSGKLWTLTQDAYKKVILINAQKRTPLTLLLGVLFLLDVHFSALAAEPKTQTRFESEANEQTSAYTDRTAGFSLSLPKDFRLSSEQPGLLYFQSAERSGTMIIRTVPGLSLSNVQTRLRNGLSAQSITMKPTGSPETLRLQGAQGLMIDAQGHMRGREISGKLASIFGPNGQGYMVLISSVREHWLGLQSTAEKMLSSFKVIRAQPGFEHERWEYRLSGAALVHYGQQQKYIRGAAYAEVYQFCRDGTFRSGFNTDQAQLDGWRRDSFSMGLKSKGTWSVSYDENYAYLTLTNNPNPRQMFVLSESTGRILMNSVPFQFATNKLCP